ncbi:hypothetical protein [Streptomyces griseus]|uniref:hypothetical protein n=1 Tax=Streptomyces griseus TaxID=1911 RepID=UPI00131BDF0C|nr:hypothetical protein [Streptomyces griseus]
MTLDAARAMSRVVGRRTALRCLAVGVGASLLAACKSGEKHKGGDKAAGGGTGSSGGSGGESSPSPTSGVTGRALAAFVRGSWKITSETTGGDTVSYSARVDDGVWTLDFGGGKSQKGTWAFQGGRLALRAPEHLNGGSSSDELADAAAANVPATVGDSVSLLLPWQPPGFPSTDSGQQLDVNYTKKTGVLRIRHMEASGMTVHTCTRA